MAKSAAKKSSGTEANRVTEANAIEIEYVTIRIPVRMFTPAKPGAINPHTPYHIDIGGMSSQETAAAAAIVSGCLRDEVSINPTRRGLCTSAAKALRYVLQLVAIELGDPPLHLRDKQ